MKLQTSLLAFARYARRRHRRRILILRVPFANYKGRRRLGKCTKFLPSKTALFAQVFGYTSGFAAFVKTKALPTTLKEILSTAVKVNNFIIISSRNDRILKVFCQGIERNAFIHELFTWQIFLTV
jgi:hypothetical protein